MKTRSNSVCIGISLPLVLVLMAGLISVSAWSAAAEDFSLAPNPDADADGDQVTSYIGGDVGVAILQNQVFHGNVYGFDVGPRVDVSAGYNITKNIAVGFQGGFAHNAFSSVDGQSISGWSANIWTFPVMINGAYSYQFDDHWQAYGGLGIGIVISSIQENDSGLHSSATEYEFGYQAQVGIKYVFNEHWDCGLGYNFLGTPDHHYTWSNGNHIDSSPTYLHSILLSFSYRF